MLQGMVGEIVMKARAGGLTHAELLEEVSRQYVIHVLEAHKGNQQRASEELKMHRNTLRRTAQALGVNTRVIRHEQSMKRKPVASVAAVNKKGEQIG